MLKLKVTIFLIGLMCLSSVSGFLTVICHGFDGHTTIEPVIHNHCECPEIDDEDKITRAMIELSTDHDHCNDTIAALNVVAPAQKNVKLLTQKIFAASLFLKSDVARNSMYNLAVRRDQAASFHTPLQTIILLV